MPLPKRLLLNAEAGGDVSAGGGDPPAAPPSSTNGSPAAPPASPAPAWYAPAESLKTSDPEIWDSFEKSVKSGGHKDFAGVVKHAISLEKKLGGALAVPNKDKPEEVTAFKQKMIAAGILPAIPESPDKYSVALDAIPEPMRSESVVTALKTWAHKNGIPNEAVNELVAIEAQRYNEVVAPALKYTTEQGEAAIKEFATSIGKDPEIVSAYGGAWLSKNFSEDEIQAMEKSGFANSPTALKFAVRAGLDTGEDISVVEGVGSLVDTELNEFTAKLTDKNSPEYQLYMKGDPQDPKRQALMTKREELLKRKFGTGEVK